VDPEPAFDFDTFTDLDLAFEFNEDLIWLPKFVRIRAVPDPRHWQKEAVLPFRIRMKSYHSYPLHNLDPCRCAIERKYVLYSFSFT
jgi:hypothetical protein